MHHWKDLSSVSNHRVVGMLEKTRGYCFSIHYVRGVKNSFADCLSRQPMKEAERAEEFTRFGVSCSAEKVYGVEGDCCAGTQGGC